MSIRSFIGEIGHDILSTFKNATNMGESSREGRLTVSMIISLLFFFSFLAITGDITSAACLTAGLEIVLLFVLSIF